MRPSTSRIRLAKLQVPVAQGQALALDAATEKSGPLRKPRIVFASPVLSSRGRFADHARGCPGLHVQRRHVPRIQFQEAVLQLRRDPLILRGRPSLVGTRPAEPRHRPGHPRCGRAGSSRTLRFVGGEQHVIGRRCWVNTASAAGSASRRCRCGARRRCPRRSFPARSCRRSASRRAASASANSLSLSCEPDTRQPALPSLQTDTAPSASAKHGSGRRHMIITLARQSSFAQAGRRSRRALNSTVPGRAARRRLSAAISSGKIGDDETVLLGLACSRPTARRPFRPYP